VPNVIGIFNLVLTFTVTSKVTLELQTSFSSCFNCHTARNDLYQDISENRTDSDGGPESIENILFQCFIVD
jgi:nitrate/TMAO reductase-like tetraheme cytochrome c subunit